MKGGHCHELKRFGGCWRSSAGRLLGREGVLTCLVSERRGSHTVAVVILGTVTCVTNSCLRGEVLIFDVSFSLVHSATSFLHSIVQLECLDGRRYNGRGHWRIQQSLEHVELYVPTARGRRCGVDRYDTHIGCIASEECERSSSDFAQFYNRSVREEIMPDSCTTTRIKTTAEKHILKGARMNELGQARGLETPSSFSRSRPRSAASRLQYAGLRTSMVNRLLPLVIRHMIHHSVLYHNNLDDLDECWCSWAHRLPYFRTDK